jgi:dihydrofolate reductase
LPAIPFGKYRGLGLTEGGKMRSLIVFNSISLDGYFTDRKGQMNWARNPASDPEWDAFVAGNASGGGMLVFGRVTYELMAGYWPTPPAARNNPIVAERMNNLPKVVFSRTLKEAAWTNSRLVKDGLAEEIRALKTGSGPGMAILGSGSIVSQLTRDRLIDEYQFVVTPFVLGGGRTMFEGIPSPLDLKLTATRVFSNGNVVLTYKPVK